MSERAKLGGTDGARGLYGDPQPGGINDLTASGVAQALVRKHNSR
jgi:hypothetical protein